jgi:hypothetical protein
MIEGKADRPALSETEIPEEALSEATHLLFLSGVDTSLEDYRDSVAVLFSELEKAGWKLVAPDRVDTPL